MSITEIEDIYKERNFKPFTINEEEMMDYKTIVTKLFYFVLDNSSDRNIKNKFNKYFSKLFIEYAKLNISKVKIVYVYRTMVKNKEIADSKFFLTFIQKRASRGVHGVTVITLLTSPRPKLKDGTVQKFSCKHDCYYCPNEPATKDNNFTPQPRSYLSKEPAVARANRNDFDAYKQMINRLDSLFTCGHEIDKLEIILEGGTYTEYPEEYLEEFHRDIFYSANTYFDKIKRSKFDIATEMKINITTKVRIIGVCIETRPDAIDDKWIKNFRNWGVTRIQLGVQHTDNEILKKINRGHTIEDAENCIEKLKDNCFKIDIHIMPDLPGATPEKDAEMMEKIFLSSSIQADQVKIYPCSITDYSVIKKWYEKGLWKPYSESDKKQLWDVITYGMVICPEWIRIPRVIRDIPIEYIHGGNDTPHLRQIIENDLKKTNFKFKEIRSREITNFPHYHDIDKHGSLKIRNYPTSNGKEYFISYETKNEEALYGFLRLRIPNNDKNQIYDCLKKKGLIRELHVYGNVTPVGKEKKDVQHAGIGKKLLKVAENISCENNLTGIVVISGEGVRGYYEKFGFKENETFMVKKLYLTANFMNYIKVLIIFSILSIVYIW